VDSLDQQVQTLVEAIGSDPSVVGTLAMVVLVDGREVASWYGPEVSAESTLISWSMAKSVVHAVFGLLVADGRISVEDCAPVPEWTNDTRSRITIQHLLNMRSGLLFNENYVDATTSHCIEMLFGSGQHDTAAYASALPSVHDPGEVFNYSSGTTNILSRIAGDLVGGGENGMRTFLSDRLFSPLGMTSAAPRFDKAGTFIGSSFLYATAKDFAAFGELYRQNGVAPNGQRLLPKGWVEHATTPTPVPVEERHGYGAHWWLWPQFDGFGAHGYEGQRILVLPSRRLTIVRLGKTPEADGPAMEAALSRIIAAIPEADDLASDTGALAGPE
jgi:CubicO group peptidase (beta-lactamase class C family)